jgi:proline iminopeptidase
MQKTLFDEIEPFNTGHLSSKDGHDVYFEESGNPSGQPIIFLHGGPGGGTGPKQRRFFDPKHYRIILFDQRGCGQSKPLGETQNNTTQHLIDDIETIRIHLKIDQWILFGGSWGSTLALAYGIQHKDRVQGLILRGIFLSRKHELSWFLNEVDQFFPELHAKLLSHKAHITKSNLVDTYYELVFSEDLDEAKQAAFAWNQFEGSILKLLPEEGSSSEPINYDFELARAKVQLHYIKEDCFVNGDELLKESAALNDKPVVIVQGRYDMVCPPKTAYELSKQMPNAEIIMVPDAGHSASEAGTLAALIQATEKFKKIK